LINFVDRSQRANHYARPPATSKKATRQPEIGWPTSNLARASQLTQKITWSAFGGFKLQCIVNATFLVLIIMGT